MSIVVKNKKGKNVTLLNPAEKGRKFADELHNGIKLTNSGHLKYNRNGGYIKLTNTEKAFRSGYLQARKDGARAYKAKHKRR